MSAKSLRRLERLQNYFVTNDHSVGLVDDGSRQGPVELDPSLLYESSDDEDDAIVTEDELSVVSRKEGLYGALLQNSQDLPVKKDSIGTRVYSTIPVGGSESEVKTNDCTLDQEKYLPRNPQAEDSVSEEDMMLLHDGQSHRLGLGNAPSHHQNTSLWRRASSHRHISAPDRLVLQHGKRRNADVKRWQEEYEREFKEQCTFAPALSEDAIKSKVRKNNEYYKIPIQKRSLMEWRRRESRLIDARKRADSEATFKPELNRLSRQIAEKRKQRMSVGHGAIDRPLPNHSTECVSKKMFTCRHSKEILKASHRIPMDFQHRQEYFMSKNHEKLFKLQADKGKKLNDFKANIPAHLLVSSSRLVKQMLENREERVNRMAHGDAAVIEEKRLRRKQDLDAQFKYKPDLNKKSLEMSISVDNNGQSRLKRIQAYQEDRYKECTFRPDVSKPCVYGFYTTYKVPEGNKTFSIAKALREGSLDDFVKQVKQRGLEKTRLAEETRKQRLEAELRECSFVPKINKNILKESGNIKSVYSMPGMQGFLHKLELTEKKQAELAEREKICFVQTENWTPAPTIPKPFNLSYENIS